MTILVTGGRNFNDRELLFSVLDRHMPDIVVTGCASGADALARCWTKKRGRKLRRHEADWNRYGRAAGPIRNREMLAGGDIDAVIACPGGAGTDDMIRRASAAGVAIIFIEPAMAGDR